MASGTGFMFDLTYVAASSGEARVYGHPKKFLKKAIYNSAYFDNVTYITVICTSIVASNLATDVIYDYQWWICAFSAASPTLDI